MCLLNPGILACYKAVEPILTPIASYHVQVTEIGGLPWILQGHDLNCVAPGIHLSICQCVILAQVFQILSTDDSGIGISINNYFVQVKKITRVTIIYIYAFYW